MATKTHTKAQIEQLSAALKEQRDELVDAVRQNVRAVPDTGLQGASGDSADHASSDYATELFGFLIEKQSGTLEEVEKAIDRIKADTYGTCEVCDEHINITRLKAIPWAHNCRDCQEKEDKTTTRRSVQTDAWSTADE